MILYGILLASVALSFGIPTLWALTVPPPVEQPQPTEDDLAWERLRAAVDGPDFVAWSHEMGEAS